MVRKGDITGERTADLPIDTGTSTTERMLIERPAISGMEIIAKRIQEAGLEPPITELICQSIQKSSSQTYESVWKSWRIWCSINRVGSISVTSGSDLLPAVLVLRQAIGISHTSGTPGSN